MTWWQELALPMHSRDWAYLIVLAAFWFNAIRRQRIVMHQEHMIQQLLLRLEGQRAAGVTLAEAHRDAGQT